MADAESTGTLARENTGASRWWFAGKLAISLLLIVYLATSVEWPKVWASVRTASVFWLLIGLFYIPATTLLQALRYHRLIDSLISFAAMLRLVIFQGAIGTFLANAAGSLSYIGILIKVYKVPAELAVQSTIIARLLEMFASVVVAAGLVAIAWDQLWRVQSLVLLALLLAVVVLVIAAIVIVAAGRLILPSTSRTAESRGLPSLWKTILGFGVRVMRLNRGYVASVLPKTLLYSFGVQVAIGVAMYCNVRAFGVDIGFFEAALVGIVSSFIGSLPITVFGGLGVYEVSTVGLLAIFGVPIDVGAAMILVIRAIFFLVMAIAFFVIRPPGQSGEVR